MTDEELEEIRKRWLYARDGVRSKRPYTLLDFINCGAEDVPKLLAEIDRLRSLCSSQALANP